MVNPIFLLFAAFVSSVLAVPLLPDTSALALQLSNISTPNVGLLNTSAFATTLNANFKGKCFQQKPPTEPQWIPAIFDDCANTMLAFHAAIGKIRPSGELHTPMVFGKGVSSGFELPRTFKHGSCAVLLDSSTSKDYEYMPPKDVMDAVWTLATLCVDKPGPRIGGNGVLGPKQIVSVTVYGIREARQRYPHFEIVSAMYY